MIVDDDGNGSNDHGTNGDDDHKSEGAIIGENGGLKSSVSHRRRCSAKSVLGLSQSTTRRYRFGQIWLSETRHDPFRKQRDRDQARAHSLEILPLSVVREFA